MKRESTIEFEHLETNIDQNSQVTINRGIYISDMDPGPHSFGSVDPDQRYKMKEKVEFNQQFLRFFFEGNYIFQV